MQHYPGMSTKQLIDALIKEKQPAVALVLYMEIARRLEAERATAQKGFLK